MRQPHCLSGLPPSLFLCMWLGEDSACCVARMQYKLLWGFFGQDPCRPVHCALVLPPQPVSAKDENYRRLEGILKQQLLLDD